MGMNVGGSGGGVRSEINITPLVDVVLVLLIIFMVIQPILQMGYDVNVPPKAEPEQMVATPPSSEQIIVRMDQAGAMFINKEQISPQDFPFRLSQALQGRASKMVFFAAHGDLPYEQVSGFMDMVYNNGATNLGIVLEDIDAEGAPVGEGASP